MALVTHGLGKPEAGSLVAGGLGKGLTDPNFFTARSVGTSGGSVTLTAGSGASPFACSSTGTSGGSVTLTGLGNGEATSAGTSSGSVTLTGAGAVRAVSAGESSGTVTLTAIGHAHPAAVGTSDGAANLAGGLNGQASCVGTSGGSVTLTATGSLVAASTGVSGGSALATGTGAIIARADGTSDGLVRLTGIGSMSATATGTSGGSAWLQNTVGITVSGRLGPQRHFGSLPDRWTGTGTPSTTLGTLPRVRHPQCELALPRWRGDLTRMPVTVEGSLPEPRWTAILADRWVALLPDRAYAGDLPRVEAPVGSLGRRWRGKVPW